LSCRANITWIAGGFQISAVWGWVVMPGALARLGSVGWHTTTVKLNMEVKGELQRLSGVNPQRLIRG